MEHSWYLPRVSLEKLEMDTEPETDEYVITDVISVDYTLFLQVDVEF